MPRGKGCDFGMGWSDAVMAQALMKEAKATIAKKSGDNK
jgi:hypothetical protein